MKILLLQYLERVRSSFWFLPILMTVGAVLLAFAGVAFDAALMDWLQNSWGWRPMWSAEGAEVVLGSIASSMITIAGVVFSMTLVALSLASGQLGPRTLRNLMRDTPTQVVLGTFVATFLYCLLVLRAIRRTDGLAFVPHTSVTLGLLLAVLNVGMLIYFIHHVSVSIQANEIVARIGRELTETIERLYPPEDDGVATPLVSGEPDDGFGEALASEARVIGADGDGYLQFIDVEELLALACEEKLVLRLEHPIGGYLAAGQPLVRVWPGKRASERIDARIRSAFAQGNQRTPVQDIVCSVEQLVEIAVRALSPGINDPFTAIACVDRLGSVLCRLARRRLPSPLRHDEQGRLRLIVPGIDFAAVADAALDPIRQYARSSASVTIRLLETIAAVAEFVRRPEDLAVLSRHADMIARGAREHLAEGEDRRAVAERYLTARRLIRERTAGHSRRRRLH